LVLANYSGLKRDRSCWLSLDESSGEIVPEHSVVGGGCAFPFFEGYGLEGVEGSRTRSYEARGVSVDQDHSNWFVCLHGRIFSLRHVGRGASISIKELNNNETVRENFHPIRLGKVERNLGIYGKILLNQLSLACFARRSCSAFWCFEDAGSGLGFETGVFF
jgi:hypothetical protein